MGLMYASELGGLPLLAKPEEKIICFAHLLSDTTVTLNHWKTKMFLTTAEPSFLLK